MSDSPEERIQTKGQMPKRSMCLVHLIKFNFIESNKYFFIRETAMENSRNGMS